MSKPLKYYSPEEERLNILTHGFGFVMSTVATFFLILKSQSSSINYALPSFATFGLSLMILYAASTLYHKTTEPSKRAKLKAFDHAAIFVLIAGTYTPFTLITLQGELGWRIFSIVWGLAMAGIVLKIFFAGRFKIISTLMYVGMGWIIVFAAKPMYQSLDFNGILWLSAGGLTYTIGAVLYNIEKLKFNHAIFHIFVLLGSFCHFMTIYYYVLK